jgi:hypothetical protein
MRPANLGGPNMMLAARVIISSAALLSCASRCAMALDVSLSTIPNQFYKITVGEDNEGWIINVLVREAHDGPVIAQSASVELRAGDRLMETRTYAAEALVALRHKRFAKLNAQAELFDLNFRFTEPVASKIDLVRFKIAFEVPRSAETERTLAVPVRIYQQRTNLIFPIKGDFTILVGDVIDNGHDEWSQFYAYDIAPLGPHGELVKTNGAKNEDFVMWGHDVLATADGKIALARDDLPDNPKPGVMPGEAELLKLGELAQVAGGNQIVIDHGNGEFSYFAHLQHGSLRVKKGDTVKQGQVIAKLGNSGHATGPHLHYHLMAGDTVFRCDGLPAKFSNTNKPMPQRGRYDEAK